MAGLAPAMLFFLGALSRGVLQDRNHTLDYFVDRRSGGKLKNSIRIVAPHAIALLAFAGNQKCATLAFNTPKHHAPFEHGPFLDSGVLQYHGIRPFSPL